MLREEDLMKALSTWIGACVISLLSQPALWAAETARGVVFEDANGDGLLQVNEAGVEPGEGVGGRNHTGRITMPEGHGSRVLLSQIDVERLPAGVPAAGT